MEKQGRRTTELKWPARCSERLNTRSIGGNNRRMGFFAGKGKGKPVGCSRVGFPRVERGPGSGRSGWSGVLGRSTCWMLRVPLPLPVPGTMPMQIAARAKSIDSLTLLPLLFLYFVPRKTRPFSPSMKNIFHRWGKNPTKFESDDDSIAIATTGMRRANCLFIVLYFVYVYCCCLCFCFVSTLVGRTADGPGGGGGGAGHVGQGRHRLLPLTAAPPRVNRNRNKQTRAARREMYKSAAAQVPAPGRVGKYNKQQAHNTVGYRRYLSAIFLHRKSWKSYRPYRQERVDFRAIFPPVKNENIYLTSFRMLPKRSILEEQRSNSCRELRKCF